MLSSCYTKKITAWKQFNHNDIQFKQQILSVCELKPIFSLIKNREYFPSWRCYHYPIILSLLCFRITFKEYFQLLDSLLFAFILEDCFLLRCQSLSTVTCGDTFNIFSKLSVTESTANWNILVNITWRNRVVLLHPFNVI